jgi:hypothetical protein
MLKKDPQDLPGQGLMRADNNNMTTVGNEYQDMLNLSLKYQPELLAAERKYGKEYVANRLANLKATQGGVSDIATATSDVAAQTQARGLAAQRTANVADVEQLGPRYLQAMMAADPQTAGLMNSMTTEAQSELDAGYNLTPAQLRLAQQSVRARNQGTLGGTGRAGDLKEAIGVSQYGQDLRNQRRGYAANVAGMRASLYGEPGAKVLQNANQADYLPMLNTALGISGVTTPTLVTGDQTSNFMNNAYGQNQQNNRATASNETFMAGKFTDMAMKFM